MQSGVFAAEGWTRGLGVDDGHSRLRRSGLALGYGGGASAAVCGTAVGILSRERWEGGKSGLSLRLRFGGDGCARRERLGRLVALCWGTDRGT
jgi:hypothetical protein